MLFAFLLMCVGHGETGMVVALICLAVAVVLITVTGRFLADEIAYRKVRDKLKN